jgi:hypothetical protein
MSRERWLCIWDGKVVYHSENDGYDYVRNGPADSDAEMRQAHLLLARISPEIYHLDSILRLKPAR